jgi:hypothetical protein
VTRVTVEIAVQATTMTAAAQARAAMVAVTVEIAMARARGDMVAEDLLEEVRGEEVEEDRRPTSKYMAALAHPPTPTSPCLLVDKPRLCGCYSAGSA